jgi:hypothetical protein
MNLGLYDMRMVYKSAHSIELPTECVVNTLAHSFSRLDRFQMGQTPGFFVCSVQQKANNSLSFSL